MKIWYGILPGYEEFILARIKESRREYGRKEQRAELLIRNTQFMKDFRKLQEKREASDNLHESGEEIFELAFSRFCEKWGVSRRWNMETGSLSKFIETKPGLLYNPIWAGLPEFDISEVKLFPDDQKPDYLYVKIDPWTTLEDMKVIWGRIEELKKAIFGYSDKEKWNFGQALCWYDLHKQEKWGYGKIASVWIQEEAPHIDDTESFRITVREGIKRIDRYIKRLTPQTEIINIPQ
jgi:hypothetical protein